MPRFYLFEELDFHLISMEAIMLVEINVTLKVTPISANENALYGFLRKIFF